MSGEQGTPTTEDAAAASYHRVLMLLPRAYRKQRGEEILGTLLDAAQDEGRSRPSVKEILSILSLSLSVRTGAPGGTTRAEALGTLLRRIALAGLLLQSAVYTIYTFGLVQIADMYWRFDNSQGWSLTHDLAVNVGMEALVRGVAVVAVSLALVLLASGRKRSGLLLAAIGPLTVVVGMGVQLGNPFSPGLNRPVNGGYLAVFALGMLSLIAAALGFYAVDGRQPARRWIVALFAVDGALIAASAVLALTHADGAATRFLFPSICVVPAVAFAVRAGRISPIWPLALLATGAPWIALLPRTITDLGGGISTLGGATGTFVAIGIEGLFSEVAFAGILAWSLYRNRATRRGNIASTISST